MIFKCLQSMHYNSRQSLCRENAMYITSWLCSMIINHHSNYLQLIYWLGCLFKVYTYIVKSLID